MTADAPTYPSRAAEGPDAHPFPRSREPRLRYDGLGKAALAGFVAAASVTAIMGAAWIPPMRRMIAARAWPTATAVVRSTNLYETKAQAPLYRSSATVTATIEFTPAGGAPIVVEQTPLFWNLGHEEAKRLRPADGATVEVRYDPADPSNICLEAWTRRHTLQTGAILAGVLASLSLLPLAVWKTAVRQER